MSISKGLGTGAIIGIVVAVIAVVIVSVVGVLFATGAFGGGHGGGNGNDGTGDGTHYTKEAKIDGLKDRNGDLVLNGQTTTERVQSIIGAADNPDPTATSEETGFHGKVKLVFNNQESYVDVVDDGTGEDEEAGDDIWTYDSDLVLKSGQNTLIIYIIDDSEEIVGESNAFTINANIPPMAIRAVLTWDTDLNDIDMHVFDPENNEAWYNYLGGIPGGQLDLDDVDGYGPETFTQEEATAGTYTIKVRYYGSNGQTEAIDPAATVIWGARIIPECEGRIEVIAIMTGVQSPHIRGPMADAMKSQYASEKDLGLGISYLK